MVNDHPWAMLSLFVVGILAVFWVMKRLLLDDDSHAYAHKGGKEARLD
jgi:hypothetical protein